MKCLIEKIRALGRLPENWDNQGAHKASQEAITDAVKKAGRLDNVVADAFINPDGTLSVCVYGIGGMTEL